MKKAFVSFLVVLLFILHLPYFVKAEMTHSLTISSLSAHFVIFNDFESLSDETTLDNKGEPEYVQINPPIMTDFTVTLLDKSHQVLPRRILLKQNETFSFTVQIARKDGVKLDEKDFIVPIEIKVLQKYPPGSSPIEPADITIKKQIILSKTNSKLLKTSLHIANFKTLYTLFSTIDPRSFILTVSNNGKHASTIQIMQEIKDIKNHKLYLATHDSLLIQAQSQADIINTDLHESKNSTTRNKFSLPLGFYTHRISLFDSKDRSQEQIQLQKTFFYIPHSSILVSYLIVLSLVICAISTIIYIKKYHG